MATSPTHILPRVTVFPILPEGHLLYKVSDALSLPPKERPGSPLIGQYAPEIVLKDQLDRDCSLHATIALGRPIVLYFFPLAGSPHCTLQGCSFRDALMESATFVEQDAIVIGVSQDSPEMLKRFVGKYDLNFIVLSDEKREAFGTFGINTKLFGLLNSRATFIIDPSGVVRGMCEGVLAARGHMAFAEKWLRRIEDEMWHRPKNAISAVMVSSLSDGATPTPHWAQGWNVERAHEKRANGNGDAAAGNSARGIPAKRSLRKGLFKRSGAPAPLPPTYENFDSGVQDYGEVEDVLSANRVGAGERAGSWEGPISRRVNGHSPTSMSRYPGSGPPSPSPLNGERIRSYSRSGSGGSQNPDGAARKHAGSEDDDDTFVPIPMPKSHSTDKKAPKSSSHRLSGVVKGGVLPPITSSLSRSGSQQQSRAVVPPPTLAEVDEDRETEAVVRSIANGAVDITPRAVPLQSAVRASPSNVSFSMAGPVPQAPKRTTSRVQHQPPILAQLSPGRITTKSSTDTVLESAKGPPPPKYSSLNSSTTFDATRAPNGVYSHNLAPRPPATRIAPVRSQPQETTKRHVVTPGGQDDDDSSDGDLTEGEGFDDDDPLSDAVQVQAAHRLTLHAQPVSPIKSGDLAAMRRERTLSKTGLSGDHALPTPASPSSFIGSTGSGGGRSNPSVSTDASIRSQMPAPALSPSTLNTEGRELSSDAGSISIASTSVSDLQRLDMERRDSERTDASSSLYTEEVRREGHRRPSAASIASSASQNSAGTFGEAS